jgi:D-beta-D-heptose 7-phosphate kinase/D-beta-D-heptose 1-phosphate adenosyltransferase
MKKKYKVMLISGGFDPVHKGHIEALNRGKELADELWVGLNSDFWLKNKKGKFFMDSEERKFIIENLKCVDHVYVMNPRIPDDTTAIDFIDHSINRYKRLYGEYKIGDLAFGNGGDRLPTDNVETETCRSLGIDLVWGLGDKIQSSSWLLEKYSNSAT